MCSIATWIIIVPKVLVCAVHHAPLVLYFVRIRHSRNVNDKASTMLFSRLSTNITLFALSRQPKGAISPPPSSIVSLSHSFLFCCVVDANWIVCEMRMLVSCYLLQTSEHFYMAANIRVDILKNADIFYIQFDGRPDRPYNSCATIHATEQPATMTAYVPAIHITYSRSILLCECLWDGQRMVGGPQFRYSGNQFGCVFVCGREEEGKLGENVVARLFIHDRQLLSGLVWHGLIGSSIGPFSRKANIKRLLFRRSSTVLVASYRKHLLAFIMYFRASFLFLCASPFLWILCDCGNGTWCNLAMKPSERE